MLESFKKYILIMGFLYLTAISLYGGSKANIDPEAGIVIDKGLEEVKKNCIVCHTGRFIVQNGGDEKFWKMKIRVMQKGFGLWELDKKTFNRIVNYLSKNYHEKWNKNIKSDKEEVPKVKLNL